MTAQHAASPHANSLADPAAGQSAGRFGSGQSVRRVEDPALITGRGQFTDDLSLPGQTHLVFLRSPYAHARILGIDTATALALPGVLAVYTGADLVAAGVKAMPAPTGFPRPDGRPGTSAPRRALAHERVRFVGETVAAVVAETPDQARAAAEALRDAFAARPEVLFVGAMASGPAGPHPIPQYEVHFREASLELVRAMITASGLTALIHPLTQDDLADHTTLGQWIGTPVALDLTTLDPPGINQGVPRFGRRDF